jgi:hypothetical protein
MNSSLKLFPINENYLPVISSRTLDIFDNLSSFIVATAGVENFSLPVR